MLGEYSFGSDGEVDGVRFSMKVIKEGKVQNLSVLQDKE
jgi:hypothetical protein